MSESMERKIESSAPPLSLKRIVALVLGIMGYGALLFLSAGTFNWWQAWAYLPVAAIFLVIGIRTALEDQVLRRELAGYQEYARKVRWRLIPGIW